METNPIEAIYSNIASNRPVLRDLYLDLRVAYTMYKASFVPSSQAEVLDSSTNMWMSYVKDI